MKVLGGGAGVWTYVRCNGMRPPQPLTLFSPGWMPPPPPSPCSHQAVKRAILDQRLAEEAAAAAERAAEEVRHAHIT